MVGGRGVTGNYLEIPPPLFFLAWLSAVIISNILVWINISNDPFVWLRVDSICRCQIIIVMTHNENISQVSCCYFLPLRCNHLWPPPSVMHAGHCTRLPWQVESTLSHMTPRHLTHPISSPEAKPHLIHQTNGQRLIKDISHSIFKL